MPNSLLVIDLPDRDSVMLALDVFVRTARASNDTLRRDSWLRFLSSLVTGPDTVVDREARNAMFASDGIDYALEIAYFQLSPGGHADFRVADAAIRIGYHFAIPESQKRATFWLSITCASQEDSTPPLIFGKILSALVFHDHLALPLIRARLNNMGPDMPVATALIHCTLPLIC